MSDPVIISQREALRLLENHPDIYFRGTRSGMIEIGSQISDHHTNWIDRSARENRDRADRLKAENKHLRDEVKTLQDEVEQAWYACWQNGELADRLHHKIETVRELVDALEEAPLMPPDYSGYQKRVIDREIRYIRAALGEENDD